MVRGPPVEIRVLSQADAIECGVTDMDACVDTMVDVFDLYDQGRVLMGANGEHMHGMVTSFPGGLETTEDFEPGPDRRFSAMPAYVGGDVHTMGIKWYGSNVANSERGLPRSIHTIVLNDPTSCQPYCLMDGQVESAMRTGAVAGLGAASVQGERASSATIIGPGVIGQTAARGLNSALTDLDRIVVYHPELWKAGAFEEAMTGEVAATIEPADDLEAAVAETDVVVAAASADEPPRIEADWLPADVVVIALGDIDVSQEAFDDDRLFCDVPQNAIEFADQVGWLAYERLQSAVSDGAVNRSDLRGLAELVGGSDTAPTTGRSMLYAPGLPMEDVAWASAVHERAAAADAGSTIELFSESALDKPY